MLHEYLENSRNSWSHKINAAQRQQMVANPKDIERSQLKLAQA
jgi:hypothetical protein